MGKILKGGIAYSGGGTSDYADLDNKPSINSTTLSGNKTTSDLGLVGENPTFTEASTRANIASGESFATILGKIKKFFTDLKTVAFTGNASDLTNDAGFASWKVLSLTQTTSTSTTTAYSFSDASILTTSTIDVYTDVFGYMPSDITVSNGACTVTMPKASTASSVTVKIYVINDAT